MQPDGRESEFTAALRALMEATGLSQQGLSDDSGTDAAVISRWVHGRTRQPSRDSIAAFATGLARQHPDSAALLAEVFRSLGYLPAKLEKPPPVVMENWGHPEVRHLWRSPDIPAAAREGMIQLLVDHLECVGRMNG